MVCQCCVHCRIISAAKQRLKYISEKTSDTDLSNNDQLPHVLLDLACYKYNDLIQRSLLLLDRYYTCETDIFQKALQSQLLLTPQSIELYNTIENLFLKLTSYLRSGSDEDDAAKGPSPVKMLTKYCWLEDEVEGFEPHQINRNIILSFGKVEIIMAKLCIVCIHHVSIHPQVFFQMC